METHSSQKTLSTFSINHTSSSFPLTKDSFQFLYIINEGNLSKIWKVQHKKSLIYLVIKETPKLLITNKEQLDTVLSEKNILSSLHNNPFITKMYCSFQDKNKLYLVLDYYNGGDLRYYAQHHKRITESQLIANISLGLEYIHSKGIIHRDIKPENIICDDKGYFHINGFTYAKRIDNKVLVGKDNIGTSNYSAPEAILKEVSSYEADFFSLGVIIYELLFYKLPYNLNNVLNIKEEFHFNRINLCPNDIPKGFHKNQLSDFINRLLCIDRYKRLGYEGVQEIKSHPWLKDFNWNGLKHQKIISDFIPKPGDFCVRKIDKVQLIKKRKNILEKNLLDDSLFQKQFDKYNYNKRPIKEDRLKRLLTMKDLVSLTDRFILTKRFRSSKNIKKLSQDKNNSITSQSINKTNTNTFYNKNGVIPLLNINNIHSSQNNEYINISVTTRNYSKEKKQIKILSSLSSSSNRANKKQHIYNYKHSIASDGKSSIAEGQNDTKVNLMSLRKCSSTLQCKIRKNVSSAFNKNVYEYKKDNKVLPWVISTSTKRNSPENKCSFGNNIHYNPSEKSLLKERRWNISKIKLINTNNVCNINNIRNNDNNTNSKKYKKLNIKLKLIKK